MKLKHLANLFGMLLISTSINAGDWPVQTRYGVVTVGDVGGDSVLLFKGKPTTLKLDGSLFFFTGKFSINDADVLLLQDSNHGTSCPATFYFATVTASGIVFTKEFGSCSDLVKTTVTGEKITVTMPGAGAAKKKSVYVYDKGSVSENGKPLK
jgi:hypothetical protein